MKKLLLILLVIPMSSFSGTHLAEQKITDMANGWSGPNLYISTDRQLRAEGCGDDPRIVLEESHSQYELLASMLLSALHAQSDVRLYVDGCGVGNFMRLKSVKIKR